MLHIVEGRHGADPIAQGRMGGHILHALTIDPHLPRVLLESLDICFSGTCGHGYPPSLKRGSRVRLRLSAAWHIAGESANRQHGDAPLRWVAYCFTVAPLEGVEDRAPIRRDAMAVGIIVPLPAYTLNPAFIASKAEALGFESIWYHEHPILPVDSASPFPTTAGEIPRTSPPFSDPYIALAMAAAVTRTIKLATGITLVTERNPLILAKEVAVLDLHSHGRFLFGVGAGWNREETTLMGGDFEHRWTQAREAVMALKELWTKDEAEFHGRYYDFPPVYCYPKPAQK